MAIASRLRLWAKGLLALALAAAPAAASTWPGAMPAQPLVQASLRCAPGIVPINRRCRVVDFGPLGQFAERSWYYAFYDTHWADRHGSQDRGFPVIFYLEKPATLRLSLWVDDDPDLAGRWALTPPARPIVIERPEAIYLGLTLQGQHGPTDQRLFRLVGLHWKGVDIMGRSPSDEDKLSAATPAGCAPTDAWRYDWVAFTLREPLRTDLTHDDCGVIVAGLAVRKDKVGLTEAKLVR
jgi:hypothetical protein